MNPTALESIDALTPEMRRKLASHWILTAEELLGACASPAGRTAMSQLLECLPDDLDGLLEIVRARLEAAGACSGTERATPGGPLGLVVPPERLTRPPSPPPPDLDPSEEPPSHSAP